MIEAELTIRMIIEEIMINTIIILTTDITVKIVINNIVTKALVTVAMVVVIAVDKDIDFMTIITLTIDSMTTGVLNITEAMVEAKVIQIGKTRCFQNGQAEITLEALVETISIVRLKSTPKGKGLSSRTNNSTINKTAWAIIRIIKGSRLTPGAGRSQMRTKYPNKEGYSMDGLQTASKMMPVTDRTNFSASSPRRRSRRLPNESRLHPTHQSGLNRVQISTGGRRSDECCGGRAIFYIFILSKKRNTLQIHRFKQ